MMENFVRESNKIEGIMRDPTPHEIEAHIDFVSLTEVTPETLAVFVSVIQPDAVLRDRVGLNVQVGSYIPPAGGPHIVTMLQELLDRGSALHPRNETKAYNQHIGYEKLHPFTDGNGRSGRALWLWHMHKNGMGRRALYLGFLHNFYYQTLGAGGK